MKFFIRYKMALFVFIVIASGLGLFYFFPRNDLSVEHVSKGELSEKNVLSSAKFATPKTVSEGGASVELNPATPSAQRSNEVNRVLKLEKSIDWQVWSSKIDSFADGSQAVVSKVTLARHLISRGQFRDAIELCKSVSPGEMRSSVAADVARILPRGSLADFVGWARNELYPEEQFKVFSAVAHGDASPSIIRDCLNASSLSSDDKSSIMSAAARSAALRGEPIEWMLETYRLLGDGLSQDAWAAFITSSEKQNRISSIGATIEKVPSKIRPRVLRQVGSAQFLESGGKASLTKAASLSEANCDPFLKGVFGSWVVNDMEGLSKFILDNAQFRGRNEAINALVDRLRNVGDQKSAEAWAAQVRQGQ